MDLSDRIQAEIVEKRQKLESATQLQRELEIMECYSGYDKVLDFPSLIKIAEEQSKNRSPIVAKMTKLDEILGGFSPQQIVVVSGPTGHGKTSLIQSFTHAFLEDNIPCLWFSYEVTGMEFYKKFSANPSIFNAYAPSELKDADLNWLESRIIEGLAKFNTRAVFIDDLHHLIGLDFLAKTNSMSVAIGLLMTRLKNIAMRTNTTIFLVAHTTKVAFDEPATLSDLRDSSFIAQHADTVLMLNRVIEKSQINRKLKTMTDKATLAVQKNRKNGRTDVVQLTYSGDRYNES